jgi:hypothetical protein
MKERTDAELDEYLGRLGNSQGDPKARKDWKSSAIVVTIMLTTIPSTC